MDVSAEKIPASLKARRQWVLWKHVERDGKPTKVPFQVNGKPASSTDPATWNSFLQVLDAHVASQGWEGIGYVFAADDPFCGIDLDGCYSPTEKRLQGWAINIIKQLDTYGEFSPSGEGIKLIVEAKFALKSGKNLKISAEQIGGKVPGIECYDRGRFFTITGQRGAKCPIEPQQRQDALDALTMEYWPVEMNIERARRYVGQIEPAISGQAGSKVTSRVAMALVKGFALNEQHAIEVMREWNSTCQPPWTERELLRKIQWAQKQGGEVGYLRDANSAAWKDIKVEMPDNAAIGTVLEHCIEALDELGTKEQRTVLSALQTHFK